MSDNARNITNQPAPPTPPARDIKSAVERLQAQVRTKFRKLKLVSGEHSYTIYATNSDLLIEASSVLPPNALLAAANYFSTLSIRDAVVNLTLKADASHGTVPFFIEWDSGVWDKGTWIGGIWKTGLWHNGVWLTGVWKSGKWENGTWRSGTHEDGEWLNGVWYSGFWKNGVWYDGIWHNGVWYDGTWKGGEWRDGIIHNMRIDKLNPSDQLNPTIPTEDKDLYYKR